jgi:hypothetical protein
MDRVNRLTWEFINRLMETPGVMLAVLLFTAVVWGRGGPTFHRPYFEAVAQIIPVLLIPLFLELRAMGPLKPGRSRRKFAFNVVVVIASGEFAALLGLADHPTAFLSYLSGSAVVLAGGLLSSLLLDRLD